MTLRVLLWRLLFWHNIGELESGLLEKKQLGRSYANSTKEKTITIILK